MEFGKNLRIDKAIVASSAFMAFMIVCAGLASATVSVTVSQSGADSGSVMAGRTFTVSASGWTGDCSSATLDLTSCGVCSVSESTSKSLSGTSVSWSTLTATEANSQSITVSVSGECTPDSGSSSFDVKSAPSLSATASPSSTSVTQGSTFPVSLSIQNSGETTAQFGTISVSPSYFSISSGCSPSSIQGGNSLGVSCTIAASASATAGTQTLTITISPTNADSITKTVSVLVNSSSTTTTTTAAGSSPGAGSAAAQDNQTSSAGRMVKSFTSILAGIPKVIGATDLSYSNTKLTEIQFTLINRSVSVVMTAEKLSAMPSGLSGSPLGGVGRTYEWISIGKTNLEDSNIVQARIKFKVARNWITANSIDPNTIALFRYSDGAWNEMQTTKLSEDATYMYFEADIPGFSYFSISGVSADGATVTTAMEADEETTTSEPAEGGQEVSVNIPDSQTAGQDDGIGRWTVFAFVCVLLAGVWYYLYKHKRKDAKSHDKKLKLETE